MNTVTQAAFSPAGAGMTALAFGRHIIRITAEQTGGSLGLFEAEVPAGEGPPFHVHEKEDEVLLVLQGSFAFWCNGSQVSLTEGGLISVPRGAVHRFQNIGTTTGRLLAMVTPGGFEGFFPAVQAANPQTPDAVGAVAARFNLRFVSAAEAPACAA